MANESRDKSMQTMLLENCSPGFARISRVLREDDAQEPIEQIRVAAVD